MKIINEAHRTNYEFTTKEQTALDVILVKAKEMFVRSLREAGNNSIVYRYEYCIEGVGFWFDVEADGIEEASTLANREFEDYLQSFYGEYYDDSSAHKEYRIHGPGLSINFCSKTDSDREEEKLYGNLYRTMKEEEYNEEDYWQDREICELESLEEWIKEEDNDATSSNFSNFVANNWQDAVVVKGLSFE